MYPVCLPISEDLMKKPIKNDHLIAVNWIMNDTIVDGLELEKFSVPIIDEFTCKDFYKRYRKLSIRFYQ